MQLRRVLLAISAVATVVWAQPQAIGTAVLAETPLITTGEEIVVEGVGKIRPVNSPVVDGIRLLEHDGTRILVARLSQAGWPAARLLFRNMALPPEAKLYLYGRDHDGKAGEVYGPFTAAGPLGSGEFWTDAVAGSEVVLEIQFPGAVPATLPLEIVGVSAEASAWPHGRTVSAESPPDLRTSWFRGRALTHAVEDGWAVYEGDIILGRQDELREVADTRGKSQPRDAVAITGSQYRWPGGIIPYTIDAALPNQSRVTAAVDHWNTTMAGHVKLVPRTSETAYLSFVRSSSASTCSSMVGRTGYAQTLNVGDYCTSGNVIHEIGHTVGLWHEQSREDRNSFVNILWENIQSGKEHNFNQHITDGDDIGTYNYGSVMHYPANAFSANGLPTIETMPAGIAIGQRTGLNSGDIAGLKLMYPSGSTSGTSTVAVTISSNPTGMPVALDGVAAVAPVTVNWVPGSVHTISAYNPAAVNGTRMTFAKWSDGGTASHQITVPASATNLRADYTTSYLLLSSAAPVGTVTLNPASADHYYTAGTSVQLAVSAPAGYCFVSWTGLVPGAPNPVTLLVTAPSTTSATLQTGALNVSPASIVASRDGGTYTFTVSATTGCAWTATSNSEWAKVVSGATGAGSGSIVVNVASKKGGNRRAAELTVGGSRLTIMQR